MLILKDKKAAKKIIKLAKKHPDWYTEEEVKYAKQFRWRITEEEVFERLRHYEKIGVMRRFAAILRHREAGFTANGMIVWKVPEDRINQVGEKFAGNKRKDAPLNM